MAAHRRRRDGCRHRDGLASPWPLKIVLDSVFDAKPMPSAFAWLAGDTQLFHAPIWQNIAYGQPDETRAAIIRAAQLAQAHAFIEALPDGYDTMVGQGGRF